MVVIGERQFLTENFLENLDVSMEICKSTVPWVVNQPRERTLSKKRRVWRKTTVTVYAVSKFRFWVSSQSEVPYFD